MKKFIDIIRFILISPEIVAGLIVLILLTYFPDVIKFISMYLFNDKMEWEDYAKLLGIPVTSLIFTYKFSDDVLNPEDNENRRKLKEWSKYWMLKNRIYYSLVLSFISLIGTLVSWYYALNIDMNNGTVFLLIFWSVSLVSFATVSLAKLGIKDILY